MTAKKGTEELKRLVHVPETRPDRKDGVVGYIASHGVVTISSIHRVGTTAVRRGDFGLRRTEEVYERIPMTMAIAIGV